MEETADDAPAPAGWIEALIESRAQIRAGNRVRIEPVLARLQASLDRMEARRGALADQPAPSE